jgi:hypothetical protein
MSVIFNSIVVDPIVFYGVIAGIVVSMIVIVFILIKSKNKKQDYITLEPIIIEDKEPVVDNNILNEDKPSNILDIKKEEIINVPVEEPTDLTNIITKMATDVDNNKKTVVASFETDQEEQAVISYQELLKLKNKIEPEVEKLNIEIEELSPQVEEAVKKFKNSEFISPVFGREDTPKKEEVVTRIEQELEKNVNTKPLATEIKQSEDFLNSLKSFRRNLE